MLRKSDKHPDQGQYRKLSIYIDPAAIRTRDLGDRDIITTGEHAFDHKGRHGVHKTIVTNTYG